MHSWDNKHTRTQLYPLCCTCKTASNQAPTYQRARWFYHLICQHSRTPKHACMKKLCHTLSHLCKQLLLPPASNCSLRRYILHNMPDRHSCSRASVIAVNSRRTQKSGCAAHTTQAQMLQHARQYIPRRAKQSCAYPQSRKAEYASTRKRANKVLVCTSNAASTSLQQTPHARYTYMPQIQTQDVIQHKQSSSFVIQACNCYHSKDSCKP
jgi:hypothetical protein